MLNNKNIKGLLSLNKQRKEKCILVLEDHVNNVRTWKKFIGVQYMILMRVA
jgi:hypothetical protein